MALLYDSSSQNLEKLELQAVDSKYGLLIPNRLFVGALEADVAETDLRNFFTNFGPVKYCKVLLDANGNSKGYGFVTFVHSEDVDKLLKKGDELMIKNKKINIGPAVRKQTLRPQLMNGGQAALNGHVLGSQGSLVMANRVPCLLQASSGASASGDPSPNTPYNLSYPQMGMMAAGGTSFKQPAMHFMMLPQQEQALINPSAFTPTQISQRQQPQVATQSVLPSGIYPQHLQQPQQQQHKQQPHLYIPSMAPSLMPGALGMDQCLYQFPYVVNPKQQQLQIQQQLLQQHHLQQQLQQQHLQQQLQTQHLQHQLQQQHILNETVPFDFFQQQQQKLQQQHLLQNMKQEQQYLMAQSKTIGSSLQYLEISDVKSSSSDAHFNTQQQPLFFASTNHNSNSNIQVTNSSADSKDTRKAMKRSLTVIQQSEALGTFKDGGVYGVPAAKVLAAESQEGVAKRHKEAERTEAS